jgi:hypothetical protein
MNKILTLSILFAVLLSLILVTVAYAQENQADRNKWLKPNWLAQIVSVDDNAFTVKTFNGKEMQIKVDDQTHYWLIGQGKGDYEDLEIGRWVIGFWHGKDGNEITARHVILLPEDFDPENLPDRRVGGLVQWVNLGDKTVTIETRNKEILTIQVKQDTHYIGKNKTLSDVKEGMVVLAGVKGEENETLEAVFFSAQYLVKRTAGTLSGVNADDGMLTIKSLQNDEITYKVNGNTKYISRNDEIKQLNDLEIGMLIVVSTKAGDQKDHLAISIAAISKEDLPEFDLKVTGKVSAITKGKFSIESEDGNAYTFQTDGETIIRGLPGKLARILKTKIGTRVFVGANQLEDDTYLAKVIYIRWFGLPWRFGIEPDK